MKNRFGSVMLVALGMVLGGALCSYDKITVATAAQKSSGDDAEALEMFRTIKTQVTQVNEILQSGKLRVVVVINPDTP